MKLTKEAFIIMYILRNIDKESITIYDIAKAQLKYFKH